MNKCSFSLLFLFILLPSIVFADGIKLDYNFNTKELLVYFDGFGSSYFVDIYKVSYEDCNSTETPDTSLYIENHQESPEIVALPNEGTYTVKVYTSIDEARSSLYDIRSIFIKLLSNNFTIEWCIPDNISEDITYTIYVKSSYDDEYEEFDTIVNSSHYTFDNVLEFGNKYFIIVTMETESIPESQHSNEVIGYVVLPPKLKSINILENEE